MLVNPNQLQEYSLCPQEGLNTVRERKRRPMPMPNTIFPNKVSPDNTRPKMDFFYCCASMILKLWISRNY